MATGHVRDSCIFPVGFIVQLTVDTDPAEYFGGKWQRIKGRFLLAADESQYTFVCNEGSTFTLNKKSHCRFGAGNSWIEKTLEKGTYEAKLSTFGNTDPAYGQTKKVEVRLDAGVTGGQETLGIYPSSFEARGYSLSTGGGFGDRAMVSDAQTGFHRKYRPPYYTVYIWERIG